MKRESSLEQSADVQSWFSDDVKRLESLRVGEANRPYILRRQRRERRAKSGASQERAQTYDHLFRVEFDPSCGIPATWIDTKTLNFFNNLRDNIFASSSIFDSLPPQALGQAGPPPPGEAKKKQKQEAASEGNKKSKSLVRKLASATFEN